MEKIYSRKELSEFDLSELDIRNVKMGLFSQWIRYITDIGRYGNDKVSVEFNNTPNEFNRIVKVLGLTVKAIRLKTDKDSKLSKNALVRFNVEIDYNGLYTQMYGNTRSYRIYQSIKKQGKVSSMTISKVKCGEENKTFPIYSMKLSN